MQTRRFAGTVLTLALAGWSLTACGGDDTSAVCDDVDDLRQSGAALQAIDIYDSNVLSDLEVVLDQISTQVRTLAEDASDEYADEVDQLQSSFDDLEASAEAAMATPDGDVLRALADDAKGFSAAFKDLRTAVGDTC